MGFIPGTEPILFPQGTTVAFMCKTWGMYVNRFLNVTWIGYAVAGGTQITKLPGVRTKFSTDFNGIKKFVEQRIATACGECGG
jgi:hypothetical protein